ncbi:hypothetical protein DFH29DRAFT_805127 [Suillus ampliporus]|nr:hypothetical protein DFH29DRAFT_805127 [Suillus ampliporus]
MPVASIVLKTANEMLLLATFHETKAANAALKQCIIILQASNILNEMYCSKLRSQLANQELKKCGGKDSGRILRDSLPWLLLGDEFYEQVIEFEVAQKRTATEKCT